MKAQTFFDIVNISFWVAGIISVVVAPNLVGVFWAYPAGWTAGEIIGRITKKGNK